MKVPPALIKRLKHHFHSVPEYSAELVLGCNGFVWVHERSAGEAAAAEGAGDAASGGGAAAMQQDDAGWGKENDTMPVGAPQAAAPVRLCAFSCLRGLACPEHADGLADAETREKLCRLANAVRVLASLFLTIAPAVRWCCGCILFRLSC